MAVLIKIGMTGLGESVDCGKDLMEVSELSKGIFGATVWQTQATTPAKFLG